jgi:hypothetical protein
MGGTTSNPAVDWTQWYAMQRTIGQSYNYPERRSTLRDQKTPDMLKWEFPPYQVLIDDELPRQQIHSRIQEKSEYVKKF